MLKRRTGVPDTGIRAMGDAVEMTLDQYLKPD
jgi:hypothetical protein